MLKVRILRGAENVDEVLKVRTVATMARGDVEIESSVASFRTEAAKTVVLLAKGEASEEYEEIAFTSRAILRVLGRRNMLDGNCPRENALVEQWLDFGTSSLDVPAAVLTYPRRGFCGKEESKRFLRSEGEAKTILLDPTAGIFRYVDDQLRDRTFLVGERLTIADIAIAVPLRSIFEPSSDLAANISAFPHLRRWLGHVLSATACSKVLGPSFNLLRVDISPPPLPLPPTNRVVPIAAKCEPSCSKQAIDGASCGSDDTSTNSPAMHTTAATTAATNSSKGDSARRGGDNCDGICKDSPFCVLQ
eukprot:g3831.t1